MIITLRTIAAAIIVGAVAACAAHYVALSCCFTPLSIVGLFGYSLRHGYWFDWLLASTLALSAATAVASFAAERMSAMSRVALRRLAGVLVLAGLAITTLVPICLWAFVFVPGVYRLGVGWSYETVQSPIVETLMDITIGSLVFALAGSARLKFARRASPAE